MVRGRIIGKLPPDKITVGQVNDAFELYGLSDPETRTDISELIFGLDDHWRQLVIEDAEAEKDITKNGDTKSSN